MKGTRPQASNLAADAAAAKTVRDLAGLLRQLRRRNARQRGDPELTYRELAAACGWSLGIVGEYFVGNVLPPTDRFDILIQLLGATPDEQKALATARDRVEESRRTGDAGRRATPPPGETRQRGNRQHPLPRPLPHAHPRSYPLRSAGELAEPSAAEHPPTPAVIPAPAAGRRATAEPSPEVDAPDTGARRSAELLSSPALPAPRQLPGIPRNFAGRELDLVRLDALLPDVGGPAPAPAPAGTPAPVVAVVSGTPGVGKTTLAVVWAHRVKHLFPDGQLYVNLRGYDRDPPATAGDVLDGFLRALNVAADRIPPTTEGRAALFRSLVDGRRMLIVLDNAGSSEQVRPLLPGSSSCLVVVTSRIRMTGLAVSVGAFQIDLGMLSTDDAVTLLRGLLGEPRAAAEPEALRQVARLCGGLPLALRLVGQRAAVRPIGQLVELVTELIAEPRPLDVLSACDDEFTAVRSVFSWSYHALPQAQARMFRLLGLHPDAEISYHAAAAVADVSPRRARSLIEDLTDAHLIEYGSQGRYRFHDLLRAYARERTEVGDQEIDRRLALRRLVGFYLHTAAAADLALHPGRHHAAVDAAPPPDHPIAFTGYDEALAWCEAERVSLIGAIRVAVTVGMPAAAWQLAASLWSFFYIRKYWTDWIQACEVGLQSATRTGDAAGQARMLSGLATAYQDLHRFEEAINYYRRTLELELALGNQIHLGSALSNLAAVHLDLRQYDAALEYSRQAIEIFQETDDLYHGSIALGNRSEAYLGLRRYDKALEDFRIVLDHCRTIRHRYGEGLTLIHLGEAYLGLHRHDDAISHLTQALDLCREIGNTHGQGVAWKIMGEVHRAAGRAGAARQAWLESLRIFDALGSPEAQEIQTQLATAEGRSH